MFNNPVTLTDPDGHWPNCSPGVRCVTPIADKRDVTKWIVAAAVDIAESEGMQSIKTANSEHSYIEAAENFIGLVGDDAVYDVKKVMDQEFGGDAVKIGDNWFEYSTPGNIIYGFYGAEVGYPDAILYMGAGYAQIGDAWEKDGELGPLGPPYYGDTMDDHFAVKFGIYLYDNYYAEDQDLTYAEFLDALDNYRYLDWMAITEKPNEFQPRYYEYPTRRFYNYR